MFREDFISPTRLIWRCLIYSLPQFPSAGIRCWDSVHRALHLLRALFSKLSARDANVRLFRSIRSLTHAGLPLQPQAFWMQRCFSPWWAPQLNVPYNRRKNAKHISHPLNQKIWFAGNKKPERFRAPRHSDAPLEGSRRGRGKLSTLLLCFEWTRICVSNQEPFLH